MPSDTLCELVVASSSGLRVVELRRGQVYVIGRGGEADVRVPDASVSRTHARLTVQDHVVALTDLGSQNGTTARDRRLEPNETVSLAPGLAFAVGDVTCALQPVHEASVSQPTMRPAVGSPPPRGTTGSHPGRHADPIVADPALRRLYDSLAIVAPTDLGILLTGETGVGKEVFAEQVHLRSHRSAKPFQCLNCAAIPEQLIEAQLFGYKKGAFTGADKTTVGLLEAAHEGTVFLDELGEMSLSLQAKLLRFLQSGEILPVGSVETRRVDVRLVSATNRDLKRAIADGSFRADLYFRINGMTIHIPPLRRRAADVLPLAQRFAELAAARLGRPPPRIAPEAARALLEHAWPGNVRELRNVVERAVIFCERGEITARDVRIEAHGDGSASNDGPAPGAGAGAGAALGPGPAGFPDEEPATAVLREDLGRVMGGPRSSPVLRNELKSVEKQLIVTTLASCRGNQSEAARVLGMSRQTLIKRLEEYGIQRPRKPSA